MRQITILMLSMFIASIAMAQKDDSQYHTILGGSHDYTGMGGFNIQVSSLGGKLAVGTGGSGAVIINRQIILGGYGFGLHGEDQFGVSTEYGEIQDVSLEHGGLWLGYIFKGSSAIHPVVSLQSGFGSVEYNFGTSKDLFDAVFVLNPRVDVEFNITRYFRLAVGANYTLTNGVSLLGMKNNDFSGPGGSISFRFGWF